jgi:hypothetical protein
MLLKNAPPHRRKPGCKVKLRNHIGVILEPEQRYINDPSVVKIRWDNQNPNDRFWNYDNYFIDYPGLEVYSPFRIERLKCLYKTFG